MSKITNWSKWGRLIIPPPKKVIYANIHTLIIQCGSVWVRELPINTFKGNRYTKKKKKTMTRNDIHFAVRQVGSRNRALNMFETDTLIILMWKWSGKKKNIIPSTVTSHSQIKPTYLFISIYLQGVTVNRMSDGSNSLLINYIHIHIMESSDNYFNNSLPLTQRKVSVSAKHQY